MHNTGVLRCSLRVMIYSCVSCPSSGLLFFVELDGRRDEEAIVRRNTQAILRSRMALLRTTTVAVKELCHKYPAFEDRVELELAEKDMKCFILNCFDT